MHSTPEEDPPLTEAELSIYGRKMPAPMIFTVFDVGWVMIAGYAVWWYRTGLRPPPGTYTWDETALFLTCLLWPIFVTLGQLGYARRRGLVLMRVLPVYRFLLWVLVMQYMHAIWIQHRHWR